MDSPHESAAHDPSNKFLNSFYQHGELKDFSTETPLFRQDRPVRYLCLLKRGLVKLTYTNPQGQAMITELREPGAILGAASVLAETPAPVSVITLTACQLHCLPAEVFLKMIETDAEFARSALKESSRKLQAQTLRFAHFATTGTRDRLAQFLLRYVPASAPEQQALEAAAGHVSWGTLSGRNKTLIGRAQTVDTTGGLTSTYECQCVCPPNPGGGRLNPENAEDLQGSTRSFVAQEYFVNCHNVASDWCNVSAGFATFQSSAPSVATVSSSGGVTAIEPGATIISASWETPYWQIGLEGWCDTFYSIPMNRSATYTVQCRVPTHELITGARWNPVAGSKHDWTQRLFPVENSMFRGRRIYESTPSPGTDDCWTPGSLRDKFDGVTNEVYESWVVNASNEWGPDTIGYSPAAVEYYRFELPRFPCGTRFRQVMSINCGSQQRQYADHEVRAGIEMFHVSSGRATDNARRAYPW